MAVDWMLYEKLLGGSDGATDQRESAINDAVSSLIEGMVNDPAYQAEAKVNGITTPMVASRISPIEAKIKLTPDSEICIGDMVDCYNQHWLVVELYTDKIGILNGKMWLCNNQINFQNNSSLINTRWCVVDNGSYSKLSDAKIITLSNTYDVYISIDDKTKKLFVDKRLGFGTIYSNSGEEILEVYKISGIDIKSKNFGEGSHLMVLTVQRDVYNSETDNIELNLCDVFTGEDPQPILSASCVITGKDSIRIGTKRKYLASFLNEHSQEATGVVPVWTVTVPSGGITYIVEGSECTINVPLKEALVGKTFTISAVDENNLFTPFTKEVKVIAIG